MHRKAFVAGVMLALALSGSPAMGADDSVMRGRRLVQRNCIGCHSAGLKDASPYRVAPPLRLLGNRHTAETLRWVMAQSTPQNHYGMPPIYLTPADAGDIAAYINAFAAAEGKAQRRLSLPPCLTNPC